MVTVRGLRDPTGVINQVPAWPSMIEAALGRSIIYLGGT